MKILVSAYACEPHKGSEPAVGWHWAVEIAQRGHQVWVLTRTNNRLVIERALEQMPAATRPQFLYCDLPDWAAWWKGSGISTYPYYLLWQWIAAKCAKSADKTIGFELVHHVTFATLRMPSFMGRFGARLIVGPAGGGEKTPWRLMTGIGPRGFATELLRACSIFFARLNPVTRAMYRQADRIIATSSQSSHLVPKAHHEKLSRSLAIGVDGATLDAGASAPDRTTTDPVRVLYVGRMLAWKGMDLGLAAFAQFEDSVGDASLTLVGDGPARARWRRLATRLGIADRTTWIPWRSRSDLSALYNAHDILIFPSLHDSGGMVVLEALAHGLPVVCLDLGGPGQIIDKTCGHIVATGGRTCDGVIADLTEGLIAVAADPAHLAELRQGARARAEEFRWDRQVAKVYDSVDADLASVTNPCSAAH